MKDPRVVERCEHRLLDIIAIAACAVICGAASFTEIEEFGLQRERWFRELLELPSGIPSHDTFARVLSLLDAQTLEACFSEWVRTLQSELTRGPISKRLSLDGKCVKGTDRRFNASTRPLMLVNVYCHESGLTLVQKPSSSSGNAEVPTAEKSLDELDIKQALISVDAGLAQRPVIHKIREKKGHYLVPVKANAKSYLR